MGDKVVALRGGKLPQPGEPQPAVVEALQELLEMAVSGEVVGVTVIYNFADESVGSRAAGFRGRKSLGEIEIAKSILIEEIRKDDGTL